jgi:ABC-type polysaccharide/polyol phosphate export permease
VGVLNPLALLAVYHFVFTTVFRTASFDGTSFSLFVAVALWPWLAAQEGLVRAARVSRRTRGSSARSRFRTRSSSMPR